MADGRTEASATAAAFGADVDVTGPDPSATGYFLVVRRDDADHEPFVRRVAGVVGGTDRFLLHNPGGLVVVATTYGVAQRLRSLPDVRLVGGVDVDVEQLRSVLAGE